MKKTIIILCTLATGFIMTGCQDDKEAARPQVSVADINFKAAASEGYILLNGLSATAEASDSWCTLRQSGDTVFVSVEDNTSMEGRNTLITLKYADGVQQQVPVNQQGGFFRIENSTELHATDSADVLSLPVMSSFNYTVDTEADWVTYEKNEKGLTFSFKKNLSKAPRHATAVINCPKLNKQVTANLYQYSVDDLMGEWTAHFINSRSQSATCTVTLDKNTEGVISVTGMPQQLILKARETGKQTFAFKLGEDLGFLLNSKIYLNGISADGNIYSYDTEARKISYQSSLTYTSGKYECMFVADSTFTDGVEMDGIVATAYDKNGNKQGTVEAFRQLILKR